MIRHISNIKPEDVVTVRSREILLKLELKDLDYILRESRLPWFGHVERSSGASTSTSTSILHRAEASRASDVINMVKTSLFTVKSMMRMCCLGCVGL